MMTFVAIKGTGKERKIIKLAVTTGGKEVIEEIADRYGMKEYEVAGRIYEWFIGEDDIFQRAVLGMLDGMEVDAARTYLERQAEKRKLLGRSVVTQSPTKPAKGTA